MPRNEDLTPKQRAKKFSEGTYTARETGARGQAGEREMSRQKNAYNKAAQGATQDMLESMIKRGGRG